ncbi:FIST C-terminal domain-containing protein, partial [bacterium]|nr:FIST C-terminal domain-containing protein [bacterium]
DYQDCFNGIKSEVGDIPIIGGSAIGIITNDNLGYERYQVGVAILPNFLTFDTAAVGELDKGEKQAGFRLGSQMSTKRNVKEKLMLLFYDFIKRPPPPAPVLNVSSYLIDGFEQGIGSNPPLLIGAGLIGSYDFRAGKQFCANKVVNQHAVCTLLSGDFSVYSTIMHGCKPMSDYHTITRVEGSIIYEIDNKPALDVIDNLLGTQDWKKRLPLLLVTIGVNYGDKYTPYNENNYVNRLIVGIKPEEKAIVLFEADFENGTEFQFMRRNAELMQDSAERGSKEAISYLQENKLDPFFALYIDCAGRTAAFSDSEKEEASIVQKIIGQNVPLLGFYSGVEIAPLLGKSRGLDWTGVLLILSRGVNT